MARWLSSDSRGGVPDLPWLTRGSLTSCTSCPQARQPSKPKCRRKEIAQGNFPILVAYTYAIGSHTKVYLPFGAVFLVAAGDQAAPLQGAKESHALHYHPPCRLLHLLLAAIHKHVCCVFLCRRSKLHPCRGPRSQWAAAVTAAATRAAGAAASAAC